MIHTTLLKALGVRDGEGWAPILEMACERHDINKRQRIAAFLANIIHESGGLAVLVENLNYGADALVKVFGSRRIEDADVERFGRTQGHPANPEAIANIVYGGEWGLKNLGNTEPGDGWRFRGRGLIQLTGRANYTRFADKIGIPLVDLPVLLETRTGAAESAANFFAAMGCNELADADDIRAVRLKINGGYNGLASVEALYKQAKDRQ